MPMEVRSLAHRGCVFVFACVWVCVLVGTGPSVSGKHCHSYINRPDRGDRHWVGFCGVRGGGRDGWKKKERKSTAVVESNALIDGFCTCVCVLSGLR